MKTRKQIENLRDRIAGDAKIAVEGLVSEKLRRRSYQGSQEEAATLADCSQEIADGVTRCLLKHYTIRDRNRK